jgi:hypothetical protein
MQARYYDPVIGRFMSNDPVGFTNVHTFNRYAYANNNPYKYIDPDGMEPVGINIGGGFTYGGVKMAASSYLLFDTKTFEIAYASSLEVGAGKGNAAGFIYNAVWTNEGATVDDFGGNGVSVSGSASKLSGAISVPDPVSGVWNADAETGVLFVNGEALEGVNISDKQIYEVGYSLGVGTSEAGVTHTTGTVVKSDIIKDIVDFFKGD